MIQEQKLFPYTHDTAVQSLRKSTGVDVQNMCKIVQA